MDSLKNEGDRFVARHPDNSKKNRYKNIYPYDNARVLLDEGNYINASYIEGFNEVRSYIASQGPKPTTVKDFWEMVWLEITSVIVMVCNCVENGKTKCEMYWPSVGITKTWRSLNVLCKNECNLGGIIRRNFIISNQQKERNLTQFHYVLWPDHGIPLTTSGMCKLRNLVNNEQKKNQSNGKIIVHCSAGAGRTGTYIAIDNLIEEFRRTDKVDVYNAVMKMRGKRKDMIQTKVQYCFVYKVMIESLLFPPTEVSIKDFVNLFSKRNWKNCVKEEFERLSLFPVGKSQQENEEVYANFSSNTSADQANTVKIFKDTFKVNTHAHYVQDERNPILFLAASEPNPENEEVFLEMIFQNYAKFIICLETPNSDSIFSSLNKAEDPAFVGPYVVSVNSVNDYNSYVLLNLTAIRPDNKDPFSFTMIRLSTWKEVHFPPNAAYLADILEKSKSLVEPNSPSTVIVFCSDGKSRTGLFLALASLIEQVKNTSSVDVFRTVKDLREMRPGSIESLDSYTLCCQLLNDYIISNKSLMNKIP